MTSVYLPPHCFCPKGHDLNWSNRSLEIDLCSVCDINGPSEKPKKGRYDCLECNQYYCLKCRKPLIIDNKCPLGHLFKEREIANCEICENKINSKGFRDSECGFVICQKCMEICETEPSDFFKHFSKEKSTTSKIAFDLLDFTPTCYKVGITVSNYDKEEESKGEAFLKKKFFMNPFCNPPRNNVKLLGQIETKNAMENENNTLLLSESKSRLKNFWAEIWLSSGSFLLRNVDNNDRYPMGVQVRKHKIKNKDEFKIGELFVKAIKNKTNNLSLKFYSKFSMEPEDWVGDVILKPENEETFLGKNYNEFLMNQKEISKQHAKIIYEYGDYIIFDIRSKSGLFLLISKGEEEKIFEKFNETEEKNINYLLLGRKICEIEIKQVTNFEWPLCDNDHVLEWVEGSNKKCSSCAEQDKTQLIYWCCPTCDQNFCNHCKSPAFFKNKRCPFYHKLSLESFRGKRPVGRRLCRLCYKQLEESYWDEKCNYEICSECKKKK